MLIPIRFPMATVFLAFSLLAISCGGSGGTGPPEAETPVAANVTISPNPATLRAAGATVQLNATVRDQWGREMPAHPLTWNSSQPEVASVGSGGLVAAKANGSTTIIAVATPAVSGWATLTVEIVPLAITTGSLPVGVVGQPYSLTLAAAGANLPSWAITTGSLPLGLALDSGTGIISGLPAEPGRNTFTVRLASGGQETSREMSITIVSADLGFGLGEDQFVLIQPGSFQMGSATGDADERPVHEVTLTTAFRLQKTEVTQAQWRAVMGSNPSFFGSCGDTCPVERVSWNDIQAFLLALNAANPGANYRLPTEAEWEYAARAGTTGDYGGTGQADDMGWYLENGASKTQFVGLKQANAWGLYDMHGNVHEWVQDWYSAGYYAVSPGTDPTGPVGGTARVLRGGGVEGTVANARSANRLAASPSSSGFAIYYGFRLAKTP